MMHSFQEILPDDTEFLILGSCRPDTPDFRYVDGLFDYVQEQLPIDRCEVERVTYLKGLSEPTRVKITSASTKPIRFKLIVNAPQQLIVESMAEARVS